MSTRLPFDISEAAIKVLGSAFWLKDPFRAFLISCGVPDGVYERYADETKYKIARHVLADLDSMGDDGYRIQRCIVSELCKLRRPPDDNVPSIDAALTAIRRLKELAIQQKLHVESEQRSVEARSETAKRKQVAIEARAATMAKLWETYCALAANPADPQGRGYGLEDLLAELFELNEIQYRRPYRTLTEQIDGHFSFGGFDYLVEARWRATMPNEADIGGFRIKVEKKITSTRGLFVSMCGFRPMVLQELTRGLSSNLVLMDGQDLALILAGHVSLTDALEIKIEKAAQEGIVFYPLSLQFSGGG